MEKLGFGICPSIDSAEHPSSRGSAVEVTCEPAALRRHKMNSIYDFGKSIHRGFRPQQSTGGSSEYEVIGTHDPSSRSIEKKNVPEINSEFSVCDSPTGWTIRRRSRLKLVAVGTTDEI